MHYPLSASLSLDLTVIHIAGLPVGSPILGRYIILLDFILKIHPTSRWAHFNVKLHFFTHSFALYDRVNNKLHKRYKLPYNVICNNPILQLDHTVHSPIRAPRFFRPNLWDVGRFWSYLRQKWSDFYSVKSLWKVKMSSIQ